MEAIRNLKVDNNKKKLNALTVAAQIAGFIGSAGSGILLFIKYRDYGDYNIFLAGLIGFFAFFLLLISSEIASFFFSNLIGLVLQNEKKLGELKNQFAYSGTGFLISGLLLAGLAYFSISNIVSLQTLKRESKIVDINSLPKVKPLYETVKNLEEALEGVKIEHQAAQERFVYYQGTNQRINQGNANQAAIKAQERKDKLEAELKPVREAYLTAYNYETQKGTTLLDRADNGVNSMLHLAGLFEIGTPSILILSFMLSALLKTSAVLYLITYAFSGKKSEPETIPAHQEPAVEPVKQEVKNSQFMPKPASELTLPEALTRARYDASFQQKSICELFNLQPYEVSRLLKRAEKKAAEIKAETGKNGISTFRFAAEQILKKVQVPEVARN